MAKESNMFEVGLWRLYFLVF